MVAGRADAADQGVLGRQPAGEGEAALALLEGGELPSSAVRVGLAEREYS